MVCENPLDVWENTRKYKALDLGLFSNILSYTALCFLAFLGLARLQSRCRGTLGELVTGVLKHTQY